MAADGGLLIHKEEARSGWVVVAPAPQQPRRRAATLAVVTFTAACIVALLGRPRSQISSFLGATTTITISTVPSNSSVSSDELKGTSNTSTMIVTRKPALPLDESQYGDAELGYTGLRTIVPEEVTYQSPASATPLFVTPYPGPQRQLDTRWSNPVVASYVPTFVREVSASTFTDTPTTPLGTRVAVSYLPAVALAYATAAAQQRSLAQAPAPRVWTDDFDEMGREGEREREQEEARGEWMHVPPPPPPPWLAHPLPRFRSNVANVAAPDECEECARQAWKVGPHDR